MAKNRRSVIDPRWVLVFVFFVAGAFTGGLSTYLYLNVGPVSLVKFHLPKGTYQYINPTLATEPVTDYNNFSSVNKDLELQINGIIEEAKKQNMVTDAGLYFRDLEPGTWLANNANMQFSPGVLLKIPIMIAYFRLAQQNPSVLDERILFKGSYAPDEDILDNSPPLVQNREYTVNELITAMIAHSDYTAAILLFDHIDKNLLNEVFSDLGIDFIEDKVTRDYISIKRYSLFFRALYNATYLTPEYSEKALGLLAEAKSNSYLGSNLPNSINFASRIGGRKYSVGGKNEVEAYECDVIYYPQHNYLICAVAHARQLSDIKNLFEKIGTALYQNQSYQYGQ